jgi:uncharacterized membrane protein YoaK (UPF0700 family)
MLRYEKRYQALAIGLAALAGFVDALGFLQLKGLFVSFMSGNSTRMAVGVLIDRNISTVAALLIAAFLAGVVAGALLGQWADRWRKQAVLGLVTLLLLSASVASLAGMEASSLTVVMAGAMGAANTVFQRDGEVTIGVTYMTGTLVKLGQKLADATMGGPLSAAFPYLLLWTGLIAGGVAGAAVYPLLGLQALWIATGGAACLLAGAVVLGPLATSFRDDRQRFRRL